MGFGGTTNTSGGKSTGGLPSTGGNESTGGLPSTGGSRTTAGNASTGGNVSTGGQSNSGGALNACGTASGTQGGLPRQSDILSSMRLANTYFTNQWPDPTVNITTNPARPSNLWTRAVYFEGLMGLYGVETDTTLKTGYHNYAVTWGAAPAHPWQLYGGVNTTRDANSQCCGQTYIDLYNLDTSQSVRIQNIKADIDAMTVAGSSDGDWTWIDAIQMAMPVFAKLGAVYTTNSAYFSKMYSLYENTKTTQGLYDTTKHLWWRDATFKPPSTTQCYWSRGNGWVFAALTRVLDTIPATESHRSEYIADFTAMAGALKSIQRSDGFWNQSLIGPNADDGPELTGTALFAYGMAWGLRKGILDSSYGPIVAKAWCAMASAVHSNGFLGYVQGSGSGPAAAGVVTLNSVPDFQDFGVGCFLLAGSETYKLAVP